MREIEKWWSVDSAIESFSDKKIIEFASFLTKSSTVDCWIKFANFSTKSLINNCRDSSIDDSICLIVLLKIELSSDESLKLTIVTKRENCFFSRIELSMTNRIVKIFSTSNSFVKRSSCRRNFSIMINHVASIICHEYE